MTATNSAKTQQRQPTKRSENVHPGGYRYRRKSGNATLVILGVLLLGSLIGLFTSDSKPVAGLWCIAIMVLLMFASVPVGFALSIPSLLGIYAISGVTATENVFAVAPFSAVSSWSYSVLPMFIFMGMLLGQSGMANRIYTATDRWFSWLPGGLGVGTVAAGAGLASVSGSTVGVTYTLARVGIPEMLRAGYDKRLAVGTVMVSGLSGGLIPPSILLVVYAGIAAVPVGPQLMAGVIPGFLLAITFALFILVLGVLFPRLVGQDGRGRNAHTVQVTWGMRFRSLAEIWGFPVIMLVLFGGMFSGAFTPTEAGAAAALTTLFLTLWEKRRSNPWRNIARAAVSTVSASAAILFLIIGAELLTRLLAITGLAPLITDFIVQLGLNRVSFLLVLVVFYLIMGMFFDTFSVIMLTVPVLLPSIVAMDINLLWFGVFVVLLGELAMITPPVGMLAFVVHNITKDQAVNLGKSISLGDIFTAIGWFLSVGVLFLIVMIAVPGLVEFLPNLMEPSQ